MLRGWFESTFGDGALLAQLVVLLILLVLILAILAWLLGRRSGNGMSKGPARGRQPRLSVMEAAVVDGKRRLVLVRRDQIEHLVMIGGPSDIVVETNIVRGRPAGYAQQGRRPAAAQRPQAQPSAAPVPSHPPAHAPAATGQQMPSAAAALAATSAAATAAAVLRRPAGAGAAELSPDSANGIGNGAGYAARSGINGAGEAAADVSSDLPHAVSDLPHAVTGFSEAEEPKAVPEPYRAEPAFSPAASQSEPEVAVPAADVSDEPSSGSADEGAGELQAAESRSAAGSMAFAGLAAGAAALAAAAGTKAQRPVPDAEPELDQQVEVPADASPEPVADISAPAAHADMMAHTELPPADDVPIGGTIAGDSGQPEDAVGAPASEPASVPASEPAQEAALEAPLAEAGTPVANKAQDPFGDLESEFKKAFESSLQGLKAEVQAEASEAADAVEEVHSAIEEPAQPLVAETIPDLPESESYVAEPASLDGSFESSLEAPSGELEEQAAFEPDTSFSDADEQAPVGAIVDDLPEPTGRTFESMSPSVGEIDDDLSATSEAHVSTEIDLEDLEASLTEREAAEQATEQLSPDVPALETMESEVPEPEIAPEPELETAESADMEPEVEEPPLAELHTEPEAEPSDEADTFGTERSSSGLPAELAFLDTPADEEPEPEPEVAEPAREAASAEQPAAPAINPFPTIPESVRKSVMAAASRAVSPDITEGLGENTDTGADVATTTLGDLAQRLEKALSEQASPTDGAMEPEELEMSDADETDADETEAPGDDSADEDEDRAVIDFKARRKEEPEDTLEDEMAKLLNDLTGDTNRVG